MSATKDQDKARFTKHFGKYVFTRMPLGLKNSPVMNQGAAGTIPISMKCQFTYVYLESIIVLFSLHG